MGGDASLKVNWTKFVKSWSIFWSLPVAQQTKLGTYNLSIYLSIYLWVIPCESTEKNMTFFCLDFGQKKSKVFDILVRKHFLTKFWLFLTTIIKKIEDFIFYFWSSQKWDLQYNVLLFFFMTKVSYLLSRVKITIDF